MWLVCAHVRGRAALGITLDTYSHVVRSLDAEMANRLERMLANG